MTEERPGSADDRPAPEPTAEEQATGEQTDPREAVSGEEEPEREWWEDEGMPWKKKPGRADYACLAWFGVIAVFSLILIPTRAWLLGVADEIWATFRAEFAHLWRTERNGILYARSVFEDRGDFHRGVPTRIQDLPRDQFFDEHPRLLPSSARC